MTFIAIQPDDFPMKIKATLLHTGMGRRLDDFTSEIIETALLLCASAGRQVAEMYLDENLVDFDITRRVLTDAPNRRRSTDTNSLVKFDIAKERRRLAN